MSVEQARARGGEDKSFRRGSFFLRECGCEQCVCAMTEVLEERLATGDQRLVSEKNECGESAVKAASGCGEAQTRRLTDVCEMN